MITKYQMISMLAEDTARQIARNGQEWMKYADAPAARVSLKEKLEAMKVRVAGGDAEKTMPQKVKGREETL